MILTNKQSFAAWGDVFGDRVVATAILDRLLPMAHARLQLVGPRKARDWLVAGSK